MANPRSALIVDDERDIRELLVLTLGRMGLRVDTAADVASAKAQLAENKYDFCLTDMRLPDGTGLQVISHLNQYHPDTPVAMITAYGNVEAAVEALKAGAFDFVSKPVDLTVLRGLVQHALDLNDQRRANSAIAHQASNKLLGQAPRMEQLRNTINKVARSQAPVLIAGESGTGKELVARSIHEQGSRAAGPFIPVNCGAIPNELMESELFGHKKGSFTGATADKEGMFQAANGGTLFLDEIAELPLHMQVKLLRVIQEKTVRPVGGANELPIDVRILSATHKSLSKMVEDGRFRHDLYYRINVIELPVPPLRERRDDIPLIATSVLKRLSDEWGESAPTITDEAMQSLSNYQFPGNVRELENILERAVALCDGKKIEASDLQLPKTTEPHSNSNAANTAPSAPKAASLARSNTGSALPDALEQIERDTIQHALEACRYNKTKTAAHLGITFRALRYKLKKLEME
jgi:two-component system, NtrC family, response regulator PilR